VSIKQKKVACFLLFLSLISCRKDPSNPIIYDVFLVVGQSNNYYGDDLDLLASFVESENIKQLGRHDSLNYQIIPATEPLENHSKPLNKGSYVLTFAKLYAKNLLDKNHKVLIIPCAKTGTSFIKHDWNKGDKLFTDAVERTSYILRRYRGSKLSAILWHQGESDVNNENYQTDLDNFITIIRTELNAKHTPFILGGMVPYWVKQNNKRKGIQSIIKNTPNRMLYTKYANPEFPFVIEKKDNTVDSIHYNAKGLRELGQRYFTEFTSFE